jgi:hypothetical protein
VSSARSQAFANGVRMRMADAGGELQHSSVACAASKPGGTASASTHPSSSFIAMNAPRSSLTTSANTSFVRLHSSGVMCREDTQKEVGRQDVPIDVSCETSAPSCPAGLRSGRRRKSDVVGQYTLVSNGPAHGFVAFPPGKN